MEATCETLSIVAATLANGGYNPLTEMPVFRPEAVTDTLSLMHSCGLVVHSFNLLKVIPVEKRIYFFFWRSLQEIYININLTIILNILIVHRLFNIH